MSSVKSPHIKICGLSKAEEAVAAFDAGASYLGFMFAHRSKRRVSTRELAGWWNQLPREANRVAVFQDQSKAEIESVLGDLEFDILQFHGAESAAFCAGFGFPYWKALAITNGLSFGDGVEGHEQAQAFLLDAAKVSSVGTVQSGGTGTSFDWALWPGYSSAPLVLAGGLSLTNVKCAIEATQPWAVDVSGGVESAPGVKSIEKIQEFCSEVRDV